ncbi:MAG TPA: NF038129 family PEP-CTERM protein [Casimicrobiaceae bacterium]|nr:NF038129 family PEP-CTERM protein [Casimicrobiaceae bacterium]
MKLTTRFTLLVMLALTCGGANADQFDISLDTSSLTGTQILGFELTDDGDGTGNNTAILSNFAFGGGSALAGTEDCTLGGLLGGTGCSGNLSSGVTLTDTLDAFFTQQVTVGSSLSFTLATTNNFTGFGSPDQFAMFVCDTGLNCYSNDTATEAMLTLDLTGTPLTPTSPPFVLNAASAQKLPAPQVMPASSVPEPSSPLLLGTGLAAAAARMRRKRR